MIRQAVALCALLLTLPGVALAQGGEWEVQREQRRGGDSAHVRVGRDYTLPAGSTLDGPLLVIGGSATLDGTVQDDVTTIGGRITVGPTAVINGDLNAVGGRIDIDPAAQVNADVDEVTADWGGWSGWPVTMGDWNDRAWPWISAWMTIIRLAMVFLAGLLLTIVAPDWLRSITSRIETTPGWSFVVGGATEILITPAMILLSIALVITIIGIPLLALIPVVLGLLAVLWLAGFAAVSSLVGATIRSRQALRADGRVVDFLIGFVAISGVTILAQALAVGSFRGMGVGAPLGALGLLIEFVAWTLGLGAALLSVFNGRRGIVPPPLPPQSTPQYAQ